MAKQAKCLTCKVRYTWERELGLRKCFCPVCGERLQGTIQASKLPFRDMGPIRPLGKTLVTTPNQKGQAAIYCLDKNRYISCRWEEKDLTDPEE